MVKSNGDAVTSELQLWNIPLQQLVAIVVNPITPMLVNAEQPLYMPRQQSVAAAVARMSDAASKDVHPRNMP